MFKKIKKALVVLFFGVLAITILLFLNEKIYQPVILGKLKLRYISSENYHLIYEGEKIAGRVTAVDSWYVQKPYVYGSTTDIETSTGDDMIYFFINVCNGKLFQTKDFMEFEKYLNDNQIPKNARNWMSGDNAINIKKAEYSSSINCDKYL